MAEFSDRMQRDVGKPPFTVVIGAGDRVISASIPDRQGVIQLLTKFAGRLGATAAGANERGYLLMWLAELPDPLPHFKCLTGENWRVSFSGEIGA